MLSMLKALLFLIAFHSLSSINLIKNIFGNRSPKLSILKSDLLKEVRRVQKGLTETVEDRISIISMIEKLESENKVKEPLTSDLLSGSWNLEYTTSDTILGRKGPKKVGPILQIIDTKTLTAENAEVVEYFNLQIPRKIKAELKPITKTKLAVQFKKLYFGPLSFNVPNSFRGELDITYLDESLRISRGDKGGLFVLTRS